MQPEKIRAIVDFPQPTTAKKLLRFHGMCVWYSSFIKNFASIASPLYKLLKKGISFKWGLEQEQAFQALKLALCKEVTLTGVDYNYPLYIRTDACDVGLGAVLIQMVDGFERVIYFASKSLTPAEKRLSTPDKECLAIVWAINKFKDFLWGEEFTVLTDNDALSYLKTQHKNRRLTRWSHEIEEWGCKIMHIKGTHNVVANCLSRAPVSPTPEELDHLDGARDCYTPIFTAFVANGFLERLKSAQKEDSDVKLLVGKLTNPPLAMEDSSHSILSHKERDVPLKYCMQNDILHRKVLSFRKSAQNSRNIAILPSPSSSNEAENAGPLNLKTRVSQVEVISSGPSQNDEARNAGPSNSRVHTPNQRLNSVQDTLSNLSVNPVNNSVSNSGARTLTSSQEYILVPVLPLSLRKEILHMFHDATEAGHMGVRKTQLAIKHRFFWDCMNKDIHEYVRSCTKCQGFKIERAKPKGFLGHVPQANAVFENIFIDFIGPYPASRYRRNKYCLVVVDQLSNWVELFPMTVDNGKNVVNVLENQIFCRFGTPKTIISDSGSHFVNRNMESMCKEWSIRHVTLSAYHPNPNRAKRTNQDLVRMIGTYIEESHSNWDTHIQKFALVLRSMINDTTGFSPALLNLGREIAYPIDRALQVNPSNVDISKLATELPEFLKEIISFVKSNVEFVHNKNKRYFDAKRRDVEFQVGEKVWIRNHQLSDASKNISKKFLPNWLGPYQILKKNFDTYIIDVDSFLVPKRHIWDLKPYIERKNKFPDRKLPISLRNIQKNLPPQIPIQRHLRENAEEQNSYCGSCESAPMQTSSQLRKQNFSVAKKSFLQEFGTIRPPPRHPEFIKYRKRLNQMSIFPIRNHQLLDPVIKWRISPEMSRVYQCNDNPNFKYIDNQNAMIEMCNVLKNQVEIAIDTEFESNMFYHDCIALIQISTHETDYIIDPYVVFPHVKPLLEPILTNVNIAKIVFSENDMYALDRDFPVAILHSIAMLSLVEPFGIAFISTVIPLDYLARFLQELKSKECFNTTNEYRQLQIFGILYNIMNAKVIFSVFLIGGSIEVTGGVVILIKLRSLVPLEFIGIVGLVVITCAPGFLLMVKVGGQIHHKFGLVLLKWKDLGEFKLHHNSKWLKRFVRSASHIKIR
ncbi:Retrovirus-related Pol polyprotein from transposon opus [Folsomia candida]|uniref:RNA-directed DNA polymerase n=1 Tax=Folsomia candida TaxID=158441 RepID=A0A226F0H9_FOLCA|nr:Retrovirus-related Pol polyprotein from transposon opus [Folsomia candida]